MSIIPVYYRVIITLPNQMTPMRRFFLFFPAFVFLVFSPVLFADVFVLKDGGTLDGDLMNPSEIPRKTYKVRTADGIEMSLDAKFVERVRKGERESLTEYKAFAPFKENTVENHLEIAEWCRQQRLTDLWRRHLHRVLELDPDNKTARQLLGHFKAPDGSWTTQQEMLGSKGYIQVGNSWKTRQQIDVEQHFARRDKFEKEWAGRIDALRSSVYSNPQSRVELAAINDPLAAGALTKALPNESEPDVRILLIEALGNIGTSPALHEIARWSIDIRESNNEVRRTCFEVLKKHPTALPAIVGFYARHLQVQSGVPTINRAAYAIGQVGGRSAVPQLIDALVTTHVEVRTVTAQGTTGLNTGTNSPGGLTWGQSTARIANDSFNLEVRNALMLLTGVDFQFDKDAWKAWLIQSRRTPTFDARRG